MQESGIDFSQFIDSCVPVLGVNI